MTEIKVLSKISFQDIDIKTFRVSCVSDGTCEKGSGGPSLNIIGILFLKCPDGTKTIHNHSIYPGYIHMKAIENLDQNSTKTLHQQCFETISGGKIENFLVLGFGVNYGEFGLKLNSSTFNCALSNYLDKSNDREAMEFFTPILQTVMRKFKVEKRVGFTLDVQYIPVKIYSIYTKVYPNKHLKYELKSIKFETMDEFYSWCRKYYESDYNEKGDFTSWFIQRRLPSETYDLDFFHKFRIV